MTPTKIGFLMDPLNKINPSKDSTIALMLEAQARGWQNYYLTLKDLDLTPNGVYARIHSIEIDKTTSSWYKIGAESYTKLSHLDLLFMRKDPPFDIQYIIATYILENAEHEGLLIVNKPSALRNANEKVYLSNFKQCSPPTLFSRSKATLLKFLNQHGKIVLKPIDRMGGQSVYVLNEKDTNKYVIIEDMTKNETQHIVAQQYLPQIKTTGDKRILIINGKPVDKGITRLPQHGDHRGNMAIGGKVKRVELTERDYWLCSQIANKIKQDGLFFIGIDVIGDYITEINVTSPTGIQEINKLHEINVSKLVLDELEIMYHSHKSQLNNSGNG